MASLLAGDVDLIENPPPADLKKLRGNPNVKINQAVSNRLIYIHLDSFSTPTTVGITDAGEKNPLKDVRVRKALSMAINREAITSRIMEGLGQPTGDFLPLADVRYRARMPSRKPTTPMPPRSCWPMPAIRTASRSRWVRRTTATSMTPKWRRRWRRGGPVSA